MLPECHYNSHLTIIRLLIYKIDKNLHHYRVLRCQKKNIFRKRSKNNIFKGTVSRSVISSETQCKDVQWYLKIGFLSSMNQILMFVIFKTNYFQLQFLCKINLRISTVQENKQVLSELRIFVNRALPSLSRGSPKITRTVPLK